MGLEESMQRFDAARGEPVGNDAPSDERPLRHDDAEEQKKEPLH
jgi:hypothetical protein